MSSENNQIKISLIGLGYVGLPIALEFAKKYPVIGFDINQKRVDMMRNNIDPSKELSSEEFEGCDILFTADKEDLKKAWFHIVAVPTPIDEHNQPDLTPLLKATETVGSILKRGDYVVFESTVYPGCTEEDCIPILEARSGLKYNVDFKVGYSPERINPGDREHTLTKIKKVVSGGDAESADVVADIYASIITAGVHKAATIKVAEAAKIIENTQRDINIALMNELSLIFNKMNINTYDVLEAAGTKWNFLRFFPGLVGGHCIGVDPYYLTYKAKEVGIDPKVILAGRATNDSMGAYVAREAIKCLADTEKHLKDTRILVMGATFKENVSDIRNSKVTDIINELKSFKVNVDVIDPYASSEELEEEYNFGLAKDIATQYDGVIVAVNHTDYMNYNEDYFKTITTPNAFVFDLKGIYKTKFNTLKYWSL